MRPQVDSLRSVRFVAVAAILSAAVMAVAPAKALAQQARFFAVGDLPGGSFSSQIRDATKHNGVIDAVGGSNGQTLGCADPCQSLDTAILWHWDGTAASLTALPNLVVNSGATTPILASAITPDGAYIASRARSNALNGQRQAVRVTTALVPFASANLNLAGRFSPALSPNTAAVAVSADGAILYGFTLFGSAHRFDAVGGTSTTLALPSGATQLTPAGRAASADGSVMVASTNNPGAGRAYRYVHGAGLDEIPLLPSGGSWNTAEALSPDGNLALAAGDSDAYPNGEVYLYNASSGATTPFGSPNSAWVPGNLAGMTADGSVVAIHFGGNTRNFAYFRNSHGWFLVTAALGAAGIDVKAAGWAELDVSGISSDGTLLFGSGVHNGHVEGWVAEFPAGYLANFNPQPVAPSNTSIVGAWHVNDTESGSPAVVVFLADGTYYHIQPAVTAAEANAAPGFERGLYTWDGTTGAFTVTTLNDTNGDAGLSDSNGVLNATVSVSGDTFTVGGSQATGERIVPPAGSPLRDTLVGAWVIGNAAAADSSFVAVFDTDGTYYQAQDGPNDGGGSYDGIEKGTYAWDSGAQVLSTTSIAVDSNGEWGLSDSTGLVRFQPSVDGLTAQAGDNTGLMPAYRIIVLSVATPAGLNVTVEPEVPAGAPPVTITFEAVSGGGTTSLAIIPPASAPTLPPNFSVGDPATYYEISAPAFSGQATLCFNYAGITFGGNSPRLLHFEGGSWKDITTSVDSATTTVCGVTTSFSPFTIAGSPTPFYTRTGFYSPVNMVAGFVNTAKGGSTIPLKFNVYLNGVEKTDTAGLQFSVASIACSSMVAEDQVDWVTSDATSLRYDGQQFHQNWKTPKGTGCYIARVTTPDGKSLSVSFKLK